MCVADVSIDNGSSDADGDRLTLVQMPQSPYSIGTLSVQLTATDPRGAFSQATGDVTVLDETPPSIACPAPIATKTAPGTCAAPVTFAPPAASDVCSNPTMASTDIASGSLFPLGTTIVHGKATDAAGNTALCTTPVTVVDREPAAIEGLSLSPMGPLRPPKHHGLVDVTVTYTATDVCGPATSSLSVTFTDRRKRGDDHDDWGREDEKGKGKDGRRDDDDDHHRSKTPDFVIVDNHHVLLRADDDDEGRIYTITVTAVDAAGNRSSKSATASVPRDDPHK
jgi:hypothetical protein